MRLRLRGEGIGTVQSDELLAVEGTPAEKARKIVEDPATLAGIPVAVLALAAYLALRRSGLERTRNETRPGLRALSVFLGQRNDGQSR